MAALAGGSSRRLGPWSKNWAACGWAGQAMPTKAIEPFELGSMRLVPVPLSGKDVELYYEGFANGTLWPLYHDVIAPPEYHREWWERYCEVNRRFAERVAQVAAPDALVWVHDYQLQLVPEMLREQRPDLVIAFFLHIPFPPTRLFAQPSLAQTHHRGAARRRHPRLSARSRRAHSAKPPSELLAAVHENSVLVPAQRQHGATRPVLAREFPISIDTQTVSGWHVGMRCGVGHARFVKNSATLRPSCSGSIASITRREFCTDSRRTRCLPTASSGRARSLSCRSPLRAASASTPTAHFATRLATAGRLNGEHGDIGHTPLVYLHRSYSREEMVSFYLAADVMLVTPLRDGMNLVAKEYAACRVDDTGALVLSEFAGAADELQGAVLVSPHDIEGLKAAILRAVHMPAAEQQRRMHAMRETVRQHDVAHWTESFLEAVS